MKKILASITLIILCSCSNSVEKEDLQKLNGYWMIDKVELENDSVVEYSLSQYVDYIEIADSVGFRKKLQPNLDGTYKSTDSEEKISVIQDKEGIVLEYSTLYDTWEEKLVEISDNSWMSINADNKKYYYKRYEPLNFTEDGEEK